MSLLSNVEDECEKITQRQVNNLRRILKKKHTYFLLPNE
jgi:flagellar biosynthesis/type III secretory pathway chaperone